MEKIEFRCPKCKALPNECGAPNKIEDRHHHNPDRCEGFLCLCDGDTSAEHGETYTDQCPEAHCGHCGWGGTFPTPPAKLQAWEKKALVAGWTPPADRKLPESDGPRTRTAGSTSPRSPRAR